MELTKEQIQQIDKRLEKNGIQYWDIRLEMVDHIVSDIELKLLNGESYPSALENSFQQLGFQGNLKNLNTSRLLGINKIVRKQFFNQVKTTFYNLKHLTFLIFFIVLYTTIFIHTPVKFFKYFTLAILLIPLLIGIFFYIKQSVIKQKSGYLTYSSFYVFFAFMLLNMFFQLFQPEGVFPVTEKVQKIIWFLATIANTIFSYAGLMVHFKTLKRIKRISK